MNWGNFPKVIAAAVVIAWLTAGFVISQDTDPYVRKTGSTSTGTQTFGGTNGQIVLPPTYQPPISASGKIYNDPVLGLMIYKGGVWQQVGRTDGITGVSVQFGTSAPNTVTALRFTTGLTGSTSGTTSTVQVDLGTGSGQAMPGNQSLSGDVTGTVGATALSGSVNVSTTGTIKSSGGTYILDGTAYSPVSTDGNKKLVASSGGGTSGDYWTSQGPSSVGHWTTPTSQQGINIGVGWNNLLCTTVATTKTVVTATALILSDGSGNVTVTNSLNKTINWSASGSGGLDTGSLTIDTWYYAWIAEKLDGTGLIAIGSTSATRSGVAWPSGYTSKYAMRVACVRTKHTAATMLNAFEQNYKQTWMNNIENVTTLDGNIVTHAGAATTFTSIDLSSRVPANAVDVTMQVDLYMSTSHTLGSVQLSWDGTNEWKWGQYEQGASSQLDFISGQQVWPLGGVFSYLYKVGLSTDRVDFTVVGFGDSPDTP